MEIVYIYTIVKDKNIMTIKIDFKFLLLAIIGIVLAIMTINQSIDQFIHFAGEDNALGFFLCSVFIGIIGLAGSFQKIDK